MKHYQYFGKNHLLSLPLLIVFCPSPVWRRHISPDLWTKERAKKNPEIYSIKINFNYHFTKKNYHKNTHCKINRRLCKIMFFKNPSNLSNKHVKSTDIFPN